MHRISYKYWAIRDTTPTPEQIRLEAEVKAIHAMSGGSAGARTIAAIAKNNDFELSRYRAAKLMVKLKLESCQVPQHQYKRGVMSILKYQTCLVDSLMLLSQIPCGAVI